MHLDFDQATSFAVFAPSAFDVETEPPGIVTADARRGQLSKQFADWTECAGVGHRIGARGASNRALIDHDRLVDLFDAAQRLMRARFLLRIVKSSEEGAPEDVVDQRRFAASGHSSYASEQAQRKRD